MALPPEEQLWQRTGAGRITARDQSPLSQSIGDLLGEVPYPSTHMFGSRTFLLEGCHQCQQVCLKAQRRRSRLQASRHLALDPEMIAKLDAEARRVDENTRRIAVGVSVDRHVFVPCFSRRRSFVSGPWQGINARLFGRAPFRIPASILHQFDSIPNRMSDLLQFVRPDGALAAEPSGDLGCVHVRIIGRADDTGCTHQLPKLVLERYSRHARLRILAYVHPG